MAKVHLDIQKITQMGQLAIKYNHNTRTNPLEDLSHIDQTLTYLNHDLVNPNHVPYRDLVTGRIEEASIQAGHNLRQRKDAVLAYSIYLAYTHGAEQTNGFVVEEWEEATLSWLRGYFGTENILSAMVHLDESSPHIHALVTPITPDLRLCAKDFTGGIKKLSAIHQSYSRVMAQEPFCMELSKQHVKKAKHSSVKSFYAQINEIEALEMPQKDQEESLDAYLLRLTNYVKQKERKNLATVKHLEEKIDHLYADFRGLRIDYKQAINLYQYLVRILGSKESADQELLNLYELEHYPRTELNRILQEFKEQYQVQGDLVSTHMFQGLSQVPRTNTNNE